MATENSPPGNSPSNRHNEPSGCAAALGLIAVLGLIGLCLYVTNPNMFLMYRNYRVEIVFPDDFRGEAIIFWDASHRTDPERIPGGFRVTFPANGKLYLRNDAIFTNWHQEAWRFASGRTIEQGNSTAPIPPGEVRGWNLGAGMLTTGDIKSPGGLQTVRMNRFFLGTQAQLRRVREPDEPGWLEGPSGPSQDVSASKGR